MVNKFLREKGFGFMEAPETLHAGPNRAKVTRITNEVLRDEGVDELVREAGRVFGFDACTIALAVAEVTKPVAPKKKAAAAAAPKKREGPTRNAADDADESSVDVDESPEDVTYEEAFEKFAKNADLKRKMADFDALLKSPAARKKLKAVDDENAELEADVAKFESVQAWLEGP